MASDEERKCIGDHDFEYDLVIIGGGSGGLACSRKAAGHGAKVMVIDYVKPSTQGTKWGLGGTCVNVGCIPKKLMHTAALLGESLHDAKEYGWEVAETTHKWETMKDAVQDHIGSLNWGYRVALQDENVDYLNALGEFVDAHTIKTVNRAKKERIVTADKVVVAVGGRPWLPEDVPGAVEHALTSDDLFSLDREPGKTLVVGASYVALECAGFLAGIGFDTTVMVRSIFLRGFDQEVAEMIGAYMANHGTKFIRPAVPTSIEKNEDGKFTVKYTNRETGEEGEDVYDTVFYAAGRTADTAKLNLEAVGVETNPKNKKIIVDDSEKTSVDNIFAVGDVIDGGLELTPVAIQAGRLLADRMFAGANKLMDYVNVPTAVFTPLEYGAIGYSEDAAVETFGADNIEVYHRYFQPLEHTVAHRDENVVFGKLITTIEDNVVIGFHYVGPNAGEVTQGYCVAMKMRATKDVFDETVGIHPTVSEEFCDMTITKRSGKDPQRSGC